MKLTIIIPMYKVEKYIEKCLLSCINQNAKLGVDYEIICINDGSPDGSFEIANHFANRYEGIRAISQDNQGLSGARNAGLMHAKGDYVWFVDSDDWIAENCLQEIFKSLDDNVDILLIQYQNVFENGEIEEMPQLTVNGIVNGQDYFVKGEMYTGAPFSIFRKSFLSNNGLKFKLGILHEDVEFKPRAVLLAKTISSTDEICYNYLQRSVGNITSSFSFKNGHDLLIILETLYIFVQPYNKDVKKAMYCKIGMWMNSVLLGLRSLKDEEHSKLVSMISQKKELIFAMIYSRKAKYFIEGILMYINIHFAIWLHSKTR